MNETNSQNPESENNLDNWKTWHPDDILRALVNELKGPLSSIKGYAQILSMEPDEELHARATQNILKIADKIEVLMKDIVIYLNDYYAKSRTE